ncbi:MAG TPA: tRNA 2-thiouridine(34) synthase MnmA [Polyangiaceae bacterium]|nr:tRNA 2-thiouridine(34) synthase MnmA [Polyangiaceae bacterium]
MTRVLVAMSGGVDSSVAAARLVAEGNEVIGVTLHLWDYPDDGSVQGRCCAPEDVHDAARVAAQLGIHHYSFDRRELFRNAIVEPFVDAYLAGTTPSPCVHCNRLVKIRELLELAERLGAEQVATGHYARIRTNGTRLELLRGCDSNKDQSYFLYSYLGPSLARLRFPLGEATKPEIRAEAAELGLFGAGKGESQELCFVPTGRYDAFVAERATGRIRPGRIFDDQGRDLGPHEGIHQFTIGQRRNLGIAAGRRVYVTNIDADSGVVTVGDRSALMSDVAHVDAWTIAEDLELPAEVDCAVRYRGELHRALLDRHNDQLRVQFEQSVAAVVSGQFAVFFVGDRVVGGGQIV